MKIKVTAKEILDCGGWMNFCEDFGINEWAINEGLIEKSEEFELTFEQAKKYGLIKEEPKNYWQDGRIKNESL